MADNAPAPIGIMKKRSDFLSANRGHRHAAPGFVLLDHAREEGFPGCDDKTIRLGITITKKVGNSVVRNRMRRRFRELARVALPDLGQPGHDYVLIGRMSGIERDFDTLRAELEKGLKRLAAGKGDRARPPRAPKGRKRRDQAPKEQGQ